MARIAPTLTEKYRGVHGDQTVTAYDGVIAGTYAAASAAADGVYVSAESVGLSEITYATVTPSFSADGIQEYAVYLGAATGSGENGVVLALADKDDNLQSGNGAVTGVAFSAVFYGKP